MPNDVFMRLLFFLLCATAAVYLSHMARADVAPPPQKQVAVRAYAIDRNWVQVVADIPTGHNIPRDSLQVSVATPGYTLGKPKQADAAAGDRYQGEVTLNLPLKYKDSDPDQTLTVDLSTVYTLCSDSGDCRDGKPKSVQVTIPGVAPPPATAGTNDKGGVAGLLSALGKKLGIGGGTEQERFLKPDQAFILSTETPNDHTITARWDIADGYYLYRKKFHFSIQSADGAQLGKPRFPPGKIKVDDTFGAMEVYHKQVVAQLPVIGAKAPGHLTLTAHYQGCADAGFCYPPITKTVDINLPPAGSGSAAAAPPAAALSETDRIAHSLAAGNLSLTLASFFGIGLLLAFTPCVFPMIPILSGIIVGQGAGITTRRAFTLSLVYVLPMAVTYTAAGVAAALMGKNLQAMFQAPWIIASFSAVFVVLALSMFGLYDLQLPSSWQTRLTALSNRQRGGTLVGVAAMGLFSALIVGPCVAAPLAGTLLYISQTHNAVVGGAALFTMSLGMGLPLLIFGTSAGKLLPRAGAWMTSVKTVFGILMLGTAIWFLERILPAPVTMALWAGLLIISAVFLGALTKLPAGAGGWYKLRKGTGWMAMIYGIMVLAGAASGGQDVLQPLKGSRLMGGGAVAATAPMHFVPVKGLAGLHDRIAADSHGKPVMLDFYADWCIDCKKMERNTFSNPKVQAALSRFVVLQSDVTAYDAKDQALLNAYGLPGPPAILFFDANGKEQRPLRLVGYQDADDFMRLLHRGASM